MTIPERFTTPPRVIFEDEPEPERSVTATEALRRYTQNVRDFLAKHNEEPRLTDGEHKMVRRGYDTGERYKIIASLIRTDRFLQGAGRKT